MRDIVIAPGQSANLDSSADFSFTDSVRVSIRSRTTDIASVVMSAYRSVPQG